MISIIFHTRRRNTQVNVSYVLDFYVSHFEVLKSTFFTSIHFAPQVIHRRVSSVWISVIMYRIEIKAKIYFRVVDTSNMLLDIPVFIYKLINEFSLWISVSNGFCEFNRVAKWNKGNTIVLVRSSFQICQLELLVSYST